MCGDETKIVITPAGAQTTCRVGGRGPWSWEWTPAAKGARNQYDRNKELGVGRTRKATGLTIRMDDGYFKARQHSNNMSIWEKNKNGFQDGLEKEGTRKLATVVKDRR